MSTAFLQALIELFESQRLEATTRVTAGFRPDRRTWGRHSAVRWHAAANDR